MSLSCICILNNGGEMTPETVTWIDVNWIITKPLDLYVALFFISSTSSVNESSKNWKSHWISNIPSACTSNFKVVFPLGHPNVLWTERDDREKESYVFRLTVHMGFCACEHLAGLFNFFVLCGSKNGKHFDWNKVNVGDTLWSFFRQTSHRSHRLGYRRRQRLNKLT